MFKKPVIIGILAGLIMLFVYFFVLSVFNSFSHALDQFLELWYWILSLSTGFGVQVGLYSFVRLSLRSKQKMGVATAMVASGGISAGSMIICCLHHLVDVLPLMGLTAVVVFATKYQALFFVIGIFSSIVGIIIMLEIIQKYNLSSGLFKKLTIYNMKKAKNLVIVMFLVFLIIFVFINLNSEQENFEEKKVSEIIKLLSKSDSQNNIVFSVTPINFNFDDSIKFEIKIDTHSGSLDFDLTEVSILEDNEGNRYEPLNWSGSSSGGHHRSGVITFSKLDNKTKNIKLIIKDDPNVSRFFEWDLE